MQRPRLRLGHLFREVSGEHSGDSRQPWGAAVPAVLAGRGFHRVHVDKVPQDKLQLIRKIRLVGEGDFLDLSEEKVTKQWYKPS